MVPRLAGVAALLFAATAVLAQTKTINIEFAGEGTREVWIQEKGEEGTVPERTSVSGKAVQIEAPTDTQDRFVYVHNVETGDVATKPLDQVVRAGKWTVTESDITHTYTMVFMVAHDDQPVSAAIIKLKAGDDERQTLLTEDDKGLAAFFVVPLGDVAVTVEYESEGEDKSLPAQTFEAKRGMAEEGPFVLTIDDEVSTVEPEPTEGKPDAATTTEGKEEEEEPPRSNPFSTILNILIGLAVIGGISYGIWRYVKANPDKSTDLLQKAGVHVPSDADPAAPPKKAGPPPQILLGTEAEPPPADPGASTVAAGPAVKNPRLVRADGSIYIVQDGEQAVGREPDRDLALTGESSVSRTHAKITRSGDDVIVEDTGSTNGTYVNGQKISGPTPIGPGDTVQFGAVQYRYEE